MNEKILDFDEDLPINADSILQYLREVPEDVLSEYINTTINFADELFYLVKVVSSVSKPNLCKHLISGLSEIQLTKLNKIALSLLANDPLEEIKQLVENTFNLIIPEDASRSKAIELITRVKSLDCEYKIEALEFARISRQLRLLADIFYVLDIKESFGEMLIDRLSQVALEDLEGMIAVVNKL